MENFVHWILFHPHAVLINYMSNDWFQFKQFIIHQGQCGMKVSTDACILGALASKALQPFDGMISCLDIGTGTGLLSLMLAQELPNLQIDAVEIDKAAYEQACKNVSKSLWSNRIKVHQESFQNYFAHTSSKKYDCIISNPPFFKNQLFAPDHQRNTARHEVSFDRKCFLELIKGHLNPNGIVFLLYPISELSDVLQLANEFGLLTLKIVKIYPNAHKTCNRFVILLGHQDCVYSIDKLKIIDEEFYIRNENSYTNQYNSLMTNYYL